MPWTIQVKPNYYLNVGGKVIDTRGAGSNTTVNLSDTQYTFIGPRDYLSTGPLVDAGVFLSSLTNATLTGDPQATTPPPGDNDTSIATSAFVNSAITGFGSAGNTIGALGSRFVFWGDSITKGGQSTQPMGGEAYPIYTTLVANGAIQMISDAGYPGYTTTTLIPTFATAVAPFNPSTVPLLIGTNDAGGGRTLDAFVADYKTLIGLILSIKATPVVCTIPPNATGVPTNRKQLITQYNQFLHRYAQAKGYPLVDLYAALVDPANGNYLNGTAWSADGTHPTPVAQVAMAQKFVTDLTKRLPSNPPMLVQDSFDQNNLLANGCLTTLVTNKYGPPTAGLTINSTGTTGGPPAGTYYYAFTGLQVWGESLPSTVLSITSTGGPIVITGNQPTSSTYYNVYRGTSAGALKLISSQNNYVSFAANYTDTGAAAGSVAPPTVDSSFIQSGWGTYTNSITSTPLITQGTDAGIQGNYLRFTRRGDSTTQMYASGPPLTGANCVPGNTIQYAVRFRTNGACSCGIQLNINPSGTQNIFAGLSKTTFANNNWTTVVTEFVVPVGAISISMLIRLDPNGDTTGSGYLDLAQVSCYDLTALGVINDL